MQGQHDLLAQHVHGRRILVRVDDACLEEVHLRCADEARDEDVGRLGEDVVRARHLLDDAIAHDRDPVGDGERFDLIVGHDHGRFVQTVQEAA